MAFEPDLLEAAHALVVSLPPHGQVLFPGHSPPTHPHPPTTTPPSHSAEVTLPRVSSAPKTCAPKTRLVGVPDSLVGVLDTALCGSPAG